MNNIRWEKISIFLLSAMVLLYTSWTYERNRAWKDEISLWRDAASKSPDNPRPFANLGNAYISIGLYDKAIVQLKEAIRIYPYFAKAHNLLAVAYINKGMYDEAIVESRLALALKPNLAEAHSNLGLAYNAKGMYDEAIAEFKEALKIKPNHEIPHNNLAVAYMNKGMYDEAVHELNEVLRINPGYEKAFENLRYISQKKHKGKVASSIER